MNSENNLDGRASDFAQATTVVDLFESNDSEPMDSGDDLYIPYKLADGCALL